MTTSPEVLTPDALPAATFPMEKKVLRRCKHCALAVIRRSQTFSPRRRVAGRPKFDQLEMVTTFTYKPTLVRISARNFELS